MDIITFCKSVEIFAICAAALLKLVRLSQIMAKARKQDLLNDGKPESAYTDREVFQFINIGAIMIQAIPLS